MVEGQFAAVAAVHAARPALERAALAIEERLRGGGRLVYAGAGTSGRLAVQDGAELMPTFSWPEERLLMLMAGGDPSVFVTRPISLAFIIATVIILVVMVLPAVRQRRGEITG